MQNIHKRILEVQTVQSGALRVLCEVLKETLNDVNMIFDQTGLKIMAMDGSMVALIYLHLEAENFEHYVCENKIQVGLNMLSFFKLMKTVTNNDIVTLFIEERKEHELGIIITNADKNSTTTFYLKMLDIDEIEIRMPEVELDAIVTMPSNEFQRICRDMLNISDTITIKSENNLLCFECNGDYASQKTHIGEATHGLSFTKNIKVVNGTYSLKYINLFTKSTNLSNSVMLYLKTDYPLMLKYNVANLGEITFCLAPKMNDSN
jgi:proliferating cell nuclear antigen